MVHVVHMLNTNTVDVQDTHDYDHKHVMIAAGGEKMSQSSGFPLLGSTESTLPFGGLLRRANPKAVFERPQRVNPGVKLGTRQTGTRYLTGVGLVGRQVHVCKGC